MSAEYSKKPFIAYDAPDDKGVRAEVRVTTGVGRVDRIEAGGKGVTARVHLAVEGLRYTVNGWVPVDDPVYTLVADAKESGELVEFRTENQRKGHVDRKIPLAELRKNTEDARENTTPILAGVRKVSDSQMTFSVEAVTNPAEDPSDGSGGGVRRSALHTPVQTSASAGDGPRAATPGNPDTLIAALQAGLPQEVITAHAGALLASGASPSEVAAALLGSPNAQTENSRPAVTSGRVLAREEAPWKSYNTDGNLNLGSALVAAAVSVEHVMRRVLISQEIVSANAHDEESTDILVATLSHGLLKVADYTQRQAYGSGFITDRSAASHTRIRGIIYDTIENYVPLTKAAAFDPEARKAWFRAVYERTIQRFRIALLVTKNDEVTEALIGKALGFTTEESDSTEPAQQGAETAPQPTPEAPEAETAKAPEETVEPANETPEYMFRPSPASPDAESASQETVELLKELANEYNFTAQDSIKLGRLLEWSLGHHKASENPNSSLEQFIDFYAESGEEALRAAIEWVTQK